MKCAHAGISYLMMGFHLKMLFALVLFSLLLFIGTESIPINAHDVVEKHIITMKEMSKSRSFDDLKTLLSESVFELEDPRKIQRAVRSSRLKVIKAKFRAGGIRALILDKGLFYSWVTMKRSETSSTGWTIVKAGFLECRIDEDTDSFCIEE